MQQQQQTKKINFEETEKNLDVIENFIKQSLEEQEGE